MLACSLRMLTIGRPRGEGHHLTPASPCVPGCEQGELRPIRARRKHIMRFVSMLLIPAVLAVVAGCEQRGPFVYVLDGQQTVVLKATASATKVQQGEKVVLHVERQNKGNWQRVSRGELKPGQCWVYRPP